MSIIPKNKPLIKSLIAISIFLNLIAIIFIFTPLNLETKRQQNQSFISRNVNVTNTLINLIEKKNLKITRAELISAMDSNDEAKNLLIENKTDEVVNQNSVGRLHFSVIQNTEVINKMWVETPKELPE